MIVPRWQKALVAGVGTVAVLAATLIGGSAAALSGGSAADADLGYVVKLRNSASSCTGILISPSWVLTAGGCFGSATLPKNGAPPLATTVVVGRNDLSATSGHQARVTRVIPHPTRNLALVALSSEISDVTPAKLSAAAPAEDQVLTVSSFGRTAKEWMPDQLQSASATVTTIGEESLNINGNGETPSALCRGDAGAPAVRTTGGITDVVGLGSSSKQGGCLGETENSTAGVLSRVDGLAGWISASTESSSFVPLEYMAAVFDSREAVGVSTKTPLPAEKEYPFQVLGAGWGPPLPGFPRIPLTNVSAVMVDVSVQDQTTYTQVKLWADGTTQPPLQGLVHSKAGVEPLGNSAVIPVGANGKIRLWHSAGTAHVVVNVQGYFTKTATNPTTGGFVPIAQTRVVDTRNDVGTTGGAIPANGTRTVTLTGHGVPAGTETVFASVVMFGPTADGYLRLLPGSEGSVGSLPRGPELFFPTRTYSAGTTVKLSGNKMTIVNASSAAVQVAIDVQGYFSQNAAVGGGFHHASARVLDTRSMATRLAGGATLDFQVAGVGGIPTTGVTAAAMNIHTYKAGTEGNNLAVWPTGATRPSANVHYQPGNNAATGSINRTSLAIIPTGTNGKISVRNNSATETDVYIELEGWFQGQPPVITPTAPTLAPLGEDFSYPGAASYPDIKLISGDGNITLVDCAAGRTSVEVWSFNKADAFCFEVKGKTGYLQVELADTYGIRNYEDFGMTAKVTVDETTKSVAVPQDDWVGIGAGAGENQAVLLEIRA
jgi:hypothetical protein